MTGENEIKSRKQVHILTHKLLGNNLKCRYCESREGIHIHHIDGDMLNNNPNNLLPLCNSHHGKYHIKERVKCPKCNQLLSRNHKCPTKEERHLIAIRSLQKRDRCPKCGKLMGFDISKHSCKHPRGMLGKHHTNDTKQRISRTLLHRNT